LIRFYLIGLIFEGRLIDS